MSTGWACCTLPVRRTRSDSTPSTRPSSSARDSRRTSSRRAATPYPPWAVSRVVPQCRLPLTPEFVHLKQKWQQTKESAYKAKDGVEIAPGFTGKYHD